MTSKLRKTALIAALLAGAFALSSCGGGNDTTMPEEMAPTPEDIAKAEAEKAKEEAEKAKAEAEKAKADLAAEQERQAKEKMAAESLAKQKAANALRSAIEKAMEAGFDTTSTPNPFSADGTGYALILTGTSAPSGIKDRDAYKSMVTSVTGRAFNKRYTLADNGTITLAGTGGLATGASLTLIKLDGSPFGRSGAKVHTANANAAGGGAIFSTPGTYHGVTGTFVCAPTNNVSCTSDFAGTGQTFQLTGGDWTFKPSNPAALVSDASAVQFGWWTDNLGASNSEARVYYGPKDLAAPASPYAGGGKATYEGHAVGQYAIHRGVGADNDSGAFTADATLNATFGATPSISGTVDGFVGADGESRDWMVSLRSSAIAAGAWASAEDSGVVWTIDGDKGGVGGHWQGTFYGGSDTLTPGAVAGSFAAEHGNTGDIIGAFGAEHTE